MENCFSGTKQGRLAHKKYRQKVDALVEEEYVKHCISQESSDWPPEMVGAYNKELKRLIEERVEDELG